MAHKPKHGSYNFRKTNSKDFSRIFQGQRYIHFTNSTFFNPFWSPYWLKHVIESFTIFTSSAIIDHIILHYFPQHDFAKWLGMTWNCIWGTEIEFEKLRNRSKIFMHKNVFTLPVSFTGSYTENKPNFPWQNDLILHKKVSGVYKVVNFKDFSRPNKEIHVKFFSRP